MLDQDQQQIRLDLISSCVNFVLQSPNKDEPKKELLQYLEKGTEEDECTAELYNKQGNTDITELVLIDEMTQCEACKEHNAKEKSFCTCEPILPGSQTEKKG